jgi:hypothetical protein
MMKKSTKTNRVKRARSRKKRERTLTLICGSVYHVMNSTYIHLRTKDPNIYIYRRRRIYKDPLEKYNNRKANTYLIVPTSGIKS